MNDGAKPSPTSGMKITNSARDGMVKKTEARAKASSFARTLRLVTTPVTMANKPAVTSTVITYQVC